MAGGVTICRASPVNDEMRWKRDLGVHTKPCWYLGNKEVTQRSSQTVCFRVLLSQDSRDLEMRTKKPHKEDK